MSFALLALSLWWRIGVNVCLLGQTFFVPDEYFQSTEIAYDLVFPGGGYRTWEWQPENRLRSPLYPLLFWPLFQVIRLLQINNLVDAEVVRWLSAHGPQLVQSLFAAGTDCMTYLMVLRNTGSRPVAKWAV